MNLYAVSDQSIVDELRALISGDITLPSDKSYEAARRVFNGAIPHRPAVIVFCQSSSDVQAAVRIASHHGIPLSVRGAGHHWAGLAICPDGPVIDLSRMRQIVVDPHSRVATVAGGARVKYVATAAVPTVSLRRSVTAVRPTITFVPLWNGDQLRGERAMDYLQALGKPQRLQFEPMTYTEMLAPYDALVAEADGCHWEIRTRSLAALTPGALDAIATAVASKTSPHSLVNRHHFHGPAKCIAADATAFGVRQEHFMLEIIASWEPDRSDGVVHRQRAQDLWESLAPFSLPGGYDNQLAAHDREQAKEAYGSNGARLRSLKRRFDPDGVFACAIPLPD